MHTATHLLLLLALLCAGNAQAQKVSLSCPEPRSDGHRMLDVSIETHDPPSTGDSARTPESVRRMHALVEERTLAVSKDGGRMRLDFRVQDVMRRNADGTTQTVTTPISGKAYAVDLRGGRITINYPEGGAVDSAETATLLDFLAQSRVLWFAPALVRGARLAVGEELRPAPGKLTGPGGLADRGPRYSDVTLRLASVSPDGADERATFDFSAEMLPQPAADSAVPMRARGRMLVSTKTCRLLNLQFTAAHSAPPGAGTAQAGGAASVPEGPAARGGSVRVRCLIQYLEH